MVRSIAGNHALADGNKRLAVTVLHSTLLVNGYLYRWNEEDAEQLILRVATGESDFRWLAAYIETHVEYVGPELSGYDGTELRRRLLALRAPESGGTGGGRVDSD